MRWGGDGNEEGHQGAGREMQGSYDSYGGGCGCCCGGGGGGGAGLSLPIILAALAAATLFLFNAIIAAGRRRRKRELGEEEEYSSADTIAHIVWNGKDGGAVALYAKIIEDSRGQPHKISDPRPQKITVAPNESLKNENKMKLSLSVQLGLVLIL